MLRIRRAARHRIYTGIFQLYSAIELMPPHPRRIRIMCVVRASHMDGHHMNYTGFQRTPSCIKQFFSSENNTFDGHQCFTSLDTTTTANNEHIIY